MNTNVNYFVEIENFENEHAFKHVQLEKYESTLSMLFDSNEEMFEFYKAYGKREGFLMKKLTSKKGSNGTVKYATYSVNYSGTMCYLFSLKYVLLSANVAHEHLL